MEGNCWYSRSAQNVNFKQSSECQVTFLKAGVAPKQLINGLNEEPHKFNYECKNKEAFLETNRLLINVRK